MANDLAAASRSRFYLSCMQIFAENPSRQNTVYQDPGYMVMQR